MADLSVQGCGGADGSAGVDGEEALEVDQPVEHLSAGAQVWV